MAEYQPPRDRGYTNTLLNAASQEASAFMNLKHTGQTNRRGHTHQVAVALTTQCAYCIESHINNALQAVATREEIAETSLLRLHSGRAGQ